MLVRGTDARYLETGHLVYVADGTLFAIPFDVTTLKVSGGPVSLVEHIAQAPMQTGAADFSISRTGSLAYIAGSFQPRLQETLVWLDRQGHETPLGAPARAYLAARISPDESRIAVVIAGDGRHIWIWDTKRETLTPLTTSGAFGDSPAWTRDGQRLAFSSSGLWWQAANGTGSPERLIDALPGIRIADVVRARRQTCFHGRRQQQGGSPDAEASAPR
jgi:dipeptidyl aminopeptidase/acylaminoacyl peptidase